jgi:hypothetical protein
VLVLQVGLDPQVVVARDIEVPLDGQQLVAAEQLVLVAVERQVRRVAELQVALVEALPFGRVLAVVAARDEVGGEVVRQRDEVARTLNNYPPMVSWPPGDFRLNYRPRYGPLPPRYGPLPLGTGAGAGLTGGLGGGDCL